MLHFATKADGDDFLDKLLYYNVGITLWFFMLASGYHRNCAKASFSCTFVMLIHISQTSEAADL